MDIPLLSLATFVPFVGGTFGVNDVPGQPAYTLVAAEPITAPSHPGLQREPFVLTFHADTPEPAQGIRIFDVPGVGSTEIFLVPIAHDGVVTTYEAVFN